MRILVWQLTVLTHCSTNKCYTLSLLQHVTGRKTASVVLSAAFGVPAFPVDTHIHRLALRWGLSPANSAVDRVERDLRALFPEEQWGTLHLQLIYFGRYVHYYCVCKVTLHLH
jgi:endonuclease III